MADGAFWFAAYTGALSGELFVGLFKQLMHRRRPLHLVVDGLPAHKNAAVKAYAAATEGRLTLHFLPGYAPDLNPDERVYRGNITSTISPHSSIYKLCSKHRIAVPRPSIQRVTHRSDL